MRGEDEKGEPSCLSRLASQETQASLRFGRSAVALFSSCEAGEAWNPLSMTPRPHTSRDQSKKAGRG